jgi:hypothetical protein
MTKKEFEELGFYSPTLSVTYVALTINGLHQICKFKSYDFVFVYIGTLKTNASGNNYIESKQIKMTNVNTIEKVKQLINFLKDE